ncbi:hypothetical protein NQ318_013176 [Aromia moschata]|uniref:Retrotransposon gag domain-containing protein n=1 Tax=Aromia moschata TaxID=1265417 RepID=A0AAV8Y422_9CUCU|nr:hypothetical protein NQ318_013176 [Aromia moschata]
MLFQLAKEISPDVLIVLTVPKNKMFMHSSTLSSVDFRCFFEGQAATWWQGVKNSVHTFDDAVEALKHAFGYSKPAHQIYRELFSKEQKEEEKTDLFVKTLLSRLPNTPVLPEAIQLGHGLWFVTPTRFVNEFPVTHYQIFEDLINEARKVEVTLQEMKMIPTSSQGKPVPSKVPGDPSKSKAKKQCTYCKAYGHIRDECRKLSQKKSEPTSGTNQLSSSPPNPESTKPQVTCFGCGAIGYIRSNLSHMQSKTHEK